MNLLLPPPIGRDSPSFDAWINDNLRILKNAFSNLPAIETGNTSVTGSATVATRLTRVDRVVASFNGDASIGAITLSARPGAGAGSVLLKVFTFNPVGPALGASTTPIIVSWAAYGLRS